MYRAKISRYNTGSFICLQNAVVVTRCIKPREAGITLALLFVFKLLLYYWMYKAKGSMYNTESFICIKTIVVVTGCIEPKEAGITLAHLFVFKLFL